MDKYFRLGQQRALSGLWRAGFVGSNGQMSTQEWTFQGIRLYHVYVVCIRLMLCVLWGHKHTPLPCACFLWCLPSSAPGQVCPAPWVVTRDCHTPPNTVSVTFRLKPDCTRSHLMMCVSILLFWSVWCSCAPGPPGSPTFWLPCWDCAPQSFLCLTPVDDSDVHKGDTFRRCERTRIHQHHIYKCREMDVTELGS